jgi:hypothetical protein
MPVNTILIICLSVVSIFTYKYIILPNVWKVYLRTVIVYLLVGLSNLVYKDKYSSVNGTLIIVDALMGLQSRHIFDRLGLLFN